MIRSRFLLRCTLAFAVLAGWATACTVDTESDDGDPEGTDVTDVVTDEPLADETSVDPSVEKPIPCTITGCPYGSYCGDNGITCIPGCRDYWDCAPGQSCVNHSCYAWE